MVVSSGNQSKHPPSARVRSASRHNQPGSSRRVQIRRASWVFVGSIVPFVAVLTAGLLAGSARPPLDLLTLDSPVLYIEDRVWWPPAESYVHAAVLEAECAAAEVRYEPSELLSHLSESASIHDIARRAESGECEDEDVDELWWIRTEYAGDDARLDGALAFLLAETYRCLRDRSAAEAQYVEALALNPDLRGVVARRLDVSEAYEIDPRLPLTMGYGVLSRWEILLERDDFDPESAFELVDLLERSDPTPWSADEIERLSWRTDSLHRPERAIERRITWLDRYGGRESAEDKLEELVELVAAAGLRDYFEPVGRLVIDRAESAAARNRRTSARDWLELLELLELSTPEERARWEDWVDAVAHFNRARSREEGLEELTELSVGNDLVSEDAHWRMILEARRDDRDDEALIATQTLLRRQGWLRREAALSACLDLAGSAGRVAVLQQCWREYRRLVENEDRLRHVSASVAVDALAAGAVSAAREIVSGVPLAAPDSDWSAAAIRHAYWSARVLSDEDPARATQLFRAVAFHAPLSWYGQLAFSHLDGPEKFDALLGGLLAGAPGWSHSERLLPYLELRAVGLETLAHEGATHDAQLLGSAAPELGALAAHSTASRGDVTVASWFLSDRFDVFWRSADELASVPPSTLDIGFPRLYVKEVMSAAIVAHVDAPLIWAVMRKESGFRTDVVSDAGARGLMQMMPATARTYAARVEEIGSVSRRDLSDPEISTRLASEMLAELTEWYGCPELVTAGYNAGPVWVRRWTNLSPGMPADIWLERVTYPNARRYAREVLAARGVYARLVEGSSPDLRCNVPREVR